ncbi:hypothetical protein QCA50_006340 [Cerrena zonata]|uniref:Uncharacterized protein n=1 Tax=Cerrena zonata TaxID=2478898 RepID=A0AAW0GF98_9APHY
MTSLTHYSDIKAVITGALHDRLTHDSVAELVTAITDMPSTEAEDIWDQLVNEKIDGITLIDNIVNMETPEQKKEQLQGFVTDRAKKYTSKDH